jgi:acyl-CoA thioesterase
VTIFGKTTAIHEVGPGTFQAEIDERWWVVRGPHGGYLAAIILRALMEVQPDAERSIRSFTTHYLAAPQVGPMEIKATIQRTGKSMTYASARATQGEKVVAMSLAAFSAPWVGFEFDDHPAPELPGPEDGFPVPAEGDNIPKFLGNFDMRWLLGGQPFSGSDEATVGGWYRMREPELADAPVVAALLDAWAPAVFPRATQLVVAPTIDLTMHFRTRFPLEGAVAEDFYLGRFSSRLGREGFFEEDGELWDKNGRLIAQSRQLALALMPGA